MAEDSASGSFLGCGQLAPMRHESGLKLRSLLVEPANRWECNEHHLLLEESIASRCQGRSALLKEQASTIYLRGQQ